jgi:hypothetical protein
MIFEVLNIIVVLLKGQSTLVRSSVELCVYRVLG